MHDEHYLEIPLQINDMQLIQLIKINNNYFIKRLPDYCNLLNILTIWEQESQNLSEKSYGQMIENYILQNSSQNISSEEFKIETPNIDMDTFSSDKDLSHKYAFSIEEQEQSEMFSVAIKSQKSAKVNKKCNFFIDESENTITKPDKFTIRNFFRT